MSSRILKPNLLSSPGESLSPPVIPRREKPHLAVRDTAGSRGDSWGHTFGHGGRGKLFSSPDAPLQLELKGSRSERRPACFRRSDCTVRKLLLAAKSTNSSQNLPSNPRLTGNYQDGADTSLDSSSGTPV